MITFVLAVLSNPAVASPAVADAIEGAKSQTRFPFPQLDDKALAALEAGQVVKQRLPPGSDGPDVGVGLVVTDISKRALWVATNDPHLALHDAYTDKLLKRRGQWELWYGHLDVPFPFKDRHWVVETWNNKPLSDATGAWERGWRLDPDGLAVARPVIEAGQVPGISAETLDQAVFTPVNYGSWIMLPLSDGRTLLGYHAATRVGGSIPDHLVTSYMLINLDNLLVDALARARDKVPGHYTSGHEVMVSADGEPVPLY